MKEKPRVGVLSFHNSKETKAILNSLEDFGVSPVWIRESNLSLEMTSDGIEMNPECDVIINRLLLSTTDYPIELLGLASALSNYAPMLNPPKNVISVLNKISSTSCLSTFDESEIPNSYFGSDEKVEEAISDNTDLVQKRAIGTHGTSVSIIDESDSAISNALGRYSFCQHKVHQEGNERDVRAYVVGDEIVATMERESNEDDWRTNIARGASADSKQLDQGIKDDIVNICRKFGLDYAGVDLMVGSNGRTYFLEVNPTAGFKGLFEATNVSPAPYIAGLACRKIGFEINQNSIEKLSNSLDDSIPSCRPVSDNDEKPKIGLRAEPYVVGLEKSKKAKAKVDTGATRTNIDLELASDLGLGPLKGHAKVRTGSNKNVKKRPLVEATLKLKGIEHTIEVSLEDREHMNFDLILGRDVLEDYKIYPELSDIDNSGIEE